MKKKLSFQKLFLFVCFLLITINSFASPWFGWSEPEHVADQYAYSNTCVRVTHQSFYMFGVKVYDRMVETAFECENAKLD
jgi:hypothetical protein